MARRGEWQLDPKDPRFPNVTLDEELARLGAEMAQQDRAAKGLPPQVTVRPATGTSTETGPTGPVERQEATDAA